MTVTEPAREAVGTEPVTKAARIAQKVLAKHSRDVDRGARFPVEGIDALRRARLLCAVASGEQGLGPEGGVAALADIAVALARSCGATAMIWAMNQIQVACLLRHGRSVPELRDRLDHIVSRQCLVASVTSEKAVGGDLGSSGAAVVPSGEGLSVQKSSPVISYGAYADFLLVTARRSEDAAPNDQVLVLADREQTALTQSGVWDSLGMRGTCSPPFELSSKFSAEQVFPAPFRQIAEDTMTPIAHVLQAAVWCGLATEAVHRAARLARRRDHPSPLLGEAQWRLDALQAQISAAVDLVSRLWSADHSASMSQSARLNALKVGASELATDIAQIALRATGMPGYLEHGDHSVARILRDLLSAPLMVSNQRLLSANTTLAASVKGSYEHRFLG
ncbi:acyl-CoA dehydrogenase family protein [Nocardiopsis halotolerans]|uniref:acyl-CoA dehydrogenase family protein n=1 Tax=Nocardiopsis halotolerans TaxID=124252 RepID=UPI00034CA20B|nr:acyl-CoA dehydrogenase family protein [Nocardiopsis halotolerans]